MNDLEILAKIEEELEITLTKVEANDYSVSTKQIFFTDANDNVIGLEISGVPIKDLSLISEFKKLQKLVLTDNGIKDISPLEKLYNLEFLILNNNLINDISPIKSLFKDPLFAFLCENNPLKYPPIEIVELGQQAINEYFEDTKKYGTSVLKEAKLIIIGESGAGKTTFAKKMLNPTASMPQPNDTTLGIDIFTWSFDKQSEIEYNAKIWDFGGQDIYHGTHQFFFSNKSLFVLVADTREQKTDFNYWLNTVEQLTGDKSPLIVLLNKKFDHTWQIDEPGLKNRFGKIFKDVISVDLSNQKEIPNLQDIIKEKIFNLPQVGYILPKSWVKIRQQLSEINEKFISFEKFREICNQNQITSPKVVEIMSKLFTNIGVFTHFSEDYTSLRDIIFLDSNWLTKTVYLLLNNEKVKKKQGRINIKEIKEIWSKDELYFEINKFIELLKKFSLIYRINGSENYIVPEHLPMVQPYEKWKYSDEDGIYQFRYLFDNYMPKGIMPKLIVALHQYIPDNKYVWHRGVNIVNSVEKPDTYAEILETYGRENRFDIKIFGKYPKDLLNIIIYHFDKILKPFTKLSHEKLVPCNCDTCKFSNDPHFYEYTELLERQENKKKTIECRKKPYLDVEISELLYGINFTELRSLLINEKYIDFEKSIYNKFSALSYQIHKEKLYESFFHSNLHTIFAENGLNPVSEESTSDGRIDIHFTIGQTKYIFEIKIDSTPDSAINQINEKEYYNKFKDNFSSFILFGINFSTKKRNIDGLKVEKIEF